MQEKHIPYVCDVKRYYPHKAEYYLSRIEELNRPLVEERTAAYAARCASRPVEGEFLRRKDGSLTRFTRCLEERSQTGGERGDFHLFSDGRISYSGGLDPSVAHEKLRLTGEKMEGRCWHFDREFAQANNAFYYSMPFRVWEAV